MNTGKKIVLLTPGFPADENELVNVTYLQDLVLSYRKYFPEAAVEVITFQYPYRQGEYSWHGVPVYSADGRNKRFFPRLSAWRRVWKRLKKIQTEHGIQVIHSFWLTECTLLGQRFCERNKIPHVASIMGQDALESNKYLRHIAFNKIIVVAISERLKEQFRRTTHLGVDHIIPFGLDKEKFLLKDSVRTIDVIGVGSLIPVKRYDIFVSMIGALKREHPGIKACIIGTGPEKERLTELIHQQGLEGNIELKGEIPHTQVFDLLRSSRLFLHTSSYEGQSLVMMEALYAGLPVICFDTGRPCDGERMHVCRDEEEMKKELGVLFTASDEHIPVLVQDTAETAKRYFELYFGKK